MAVPATANASRGRFKDRVLIGVAVAVPSLAALAAVLLKAYRLFGEAGVVASALGIALALGLAGITAVIARRKGRSAVGFYVFGLCCFVLALVVVLIVPASSGCTKVQPSSGTLHGSDHRKSVVQ
jgi:hypothetical protein